MTQSSVLICKPDITLDDIHRTISERWPRDTRAQLGRCNIEIQDQTGSVQYVSIGKLEPSDEVRADYQSNDDIPASVRETLNDTVFYNFVYNNYEFCNLVIRHLISQLIPDQQQAWLDNDHGVLISARTLLKEFSADSAWDWRRARWSD